MLISQADEQESTPWVPAELHPQPLTWLQAKPEHSFPHPMHLFLPVLWIWIILEHCLAFLGLHEESPGGAKHCLLPGHFRHWLKKSVRSEISQSDSPFKGFLSPFVYLFSVIFKALVKGFNVDRRLQHDGNRVWTGQCEIKINVQWNKKEISVFLSSFLPRSLPPTLYLSEWHQPLVLQELIHCCLLLSLKSQVSANLHMELFQLWLQLWLLFSSSFYSGIPAAFIMWAQPVRGLTSHQLSTGGK